MKILKQSFFLFVVMLLVFSCRHDDLSLNNGNVTPGTNSVVLIKTGVVLSIGGIVYENLDANITVKGLNALNGVVWVKDYNFVGPTDTLAIQNGFHHYSIELVNKWGVSDIQSDIPGKDIWDGRADGPLPVTYVMSGSLKAKKISSYVTSNQVSITGTDIVYQPESRVSYDYDSDGHIIRIHHEGYNLQTLQFEETETETFTYEGNVVSKITRTLNGQLYSEYQYEYGTLDKITETNHFTGIVTTQLIRRNYETSPNDSSVSINFTFSNGSNSIIYDFGLLYKNIIHDRTRLPGEVCNLGNYTYDKYINPFKHLGYIDFNNFQNWSASNRLSENVNFLGCAYPSVIPLFYYYTYDQDGYPVKKITKYATGSNQNSAYHSEIDFYYE